MDKKTVLFAVLLTVCTLAAYFVGTEQQRIENREVNARLVNCMTVDVEDELYTIEEIDQIAHFCVEQEYKNHGI